MTSHLENVLPTSTSVQRVGLGARVNLSDGHARIHAGDAVIAAFEAAGRHFRVASTSLQSTLEADFIASFETAQMLKFPRPPVLSYSASSLAGIVGNFLGRSARVIWSVPSFDNMRDVVRIAGPEITLLPECTFVELIADPPRVPWFNTIWLTLPNNPTGYTLDANKYAQLASYASDVGVTLVIDHCFRGYSPVTMSFDQYAFLEESGCRYIVLEDTGKTISTLDLKVGMLTGSIDVHRRLGRLNEDLTLNVSPFILRVLTSILNAWSDGSGLKFIQSTVALNRQLIRGAYSGSVLSPKMHSTDVPFEWLDAGSKQASREILDACTSRGLQLLPGASFFGHPNDVGSSFIRIALARDTDVVREGAYLLQSTLTSVGVGSVRG